MELASFHKIKQLYRKILFRVREQFITNKKRYNYDLLIVKYGRLVHIYLDNEFSRNIPECVQARLSKSSHPAVRAEQQESINKYYVIWKLFSEIHFRKLDINQMNDYI